MKHSFGSAIIVGLVAGILGAAAYLLASYLNVQPVVATPSATSGKDFISAIVVAAVAGLLLALLVLLIPDRWRRIESEILELRQRQSNALEDVRKQADDRIGEKLDSATRQAQGILDHISGLAERHPWIKGISEAGFSPNSNSCQIVLRNAAKLVAEGQGLLAHDYLFSWARRGNGQSTLDGSPGDFMQLANFAHLILRDEYLAMLMLSVGYESRTRQQSLASAHLRALARNGYMSDSFDVAESIRRRALPTWRENLRYAWYNVRRIGQPTIRPPRPTVDDCSSLAIFFGVLGDKYEFERTLDRARELACSHPQSVSVSLAEAEGLATLGNIEESTALLGRIDLDESARNGLSLDTAWAMRRAGLLYEAEAILSCAADTALKMIVKDFQTKRYDDPPPPGDDEAGLGTSEVKSTNSPVKSAVSLQERAESRKENAEEMSRGA
ncbi:MAG: hypothetical protein JSS38_14695 [Nitrospira sp.]|nr:hypothetical protein [Nitrospira sp.]